DTAPSTINATSPSCVYQENIYMIMIDFITEHFSICRRSKRKEWRSEASGKGSGWLCNASFRPGKFACITTQKMIHRLCFAQFTEWRQCPGCIRSQKNDGTWVSRYTGSHDIVHVFQCVCCTCVFGMGCIIVIRNTCIRIDDDIF